MTSRVPLDPETTASYLQHQRNQERRDRTLYEQWAPEDTRCHVRGRKGQCPEKAKYVLVNSSMQQSAVCEKCLPTWIHNMTKGGAAISVFQLRSRRDSGRGLRATHIVLDEAIDP